MQCGDEVYNPRPRVGGDPPASASRSAPKSFQSTPPRGGATCLLVLPLVILAISIHAPRGGRPTGVLAFLTTDLVFQSTPPRGGRHELQGTHIAASAFQSTPPRGGRLSTSRPPGAPHDFNPRPRVGGDYYTVVKTLA